MDIWLSVYKSLEGPKLRKTSDSIGCSTFTLKGMLLTLWFWGLDNASPDDGEILHATEEDIVRCLVADSHGCNGLDFGHVVKCLISNGWIDKKEDGSLYIHDWFEHQEYWYKANKAREATAKRVKEHRKKKLEESEDVQFEMSVEGNTQEKTKNTTKKEYTVPFEEFWSAYPRKIEKGNAYKKYMTRRKDGYSDEILLEAAKNYAKQCKIKKTQPEYIKHPRTFLSDTCPFLDFIDTKSETDKEKTSNENPFNEYGGDFN